MYRQLYKSIVIFAYKQQCRCAECGLFINIKFTLMNCNVINTQAAITAISDVTKLFTNFNDKFSNY